MEFKALRTLLMRTLVLLLITFAADRVIAMGLRRALPHSGFRFSVAARGGIPSGILLIGDSRAVFGLYAPELARQLHEPVFSMAFNGMSTLIEEAMLRDALAHNPKPRMLVLEVTNIPDDHLLIEGLRCYWDSGPALGALADSLRPRVRAATRLSHLFAFNGESALRALYYARKSDQDWANHYSMEAALLDSARLSGPIQLTARPENLAALARIRAMAREAGIPVRLVVSPYLQPYAAHFSNWNEWLDRIRATGDPSERIWDYSLADSTTAHFADRLHLNEDGSIPFAQRLVADGVFKDAAPDSAGSAAQH